MENFNLEENIIHSQETCNLLINDINSSNSSISDQNKLFYLSHPIHTEMVNFNLIKEEVHYEFKIVFRDEKWLIKKTLTEIKNLIKSLINLKYVFVNESYFQSLDLSNLKEINLNIINFLRYINYRCDIMSHIICRDFFEFSKSLDPEEVTNSIKKENFELVFNFKVEESDMTMSDFLYDSDLGLLMLGLEDLSYFTRIGRFWSLIDYEILGNFYVFQRVFDNQKRPYFRKCIIKNFDTRVSKIELCSDKNKIYLGLENGVIQIFNINIINKSQNIELNEKIIAINEGNHFKYLTERVTGIQTYLDFLFISSKDNKLLILDISQSIPLIKFNGSLKKRIAGKGHICSIKIEQQIKKLFVLTITNKILIFDIVVNSTFIDTESSNEIKIEFFNEIDASSNIKNMFVKNSSIFLALEDKINIYSWNKENQLLLNEFPLDGSLKDNLSYSSKYVRVNYLNYISSISYFTDMKLFVLGLIDGTILTLNSRSLEVSFAKKVTDHPIRKFILLEENYIIIAGDERGNIFFFKLG
jgi:hypothetical protein